MLTSMLELQGTTVAQVMEPVDRIVTVAPGRRRRTDRAGVPGQRPVPAGRAGPTAARCAAWCTSGRRCGRPRPAGRSTAGELMTPAFTLPAAASVTEAVAAMRARQAQLALVTNRRRPDPADRLRRAGGPAGGGHRRVRRRDRSGAPRAADALTGGGAVDRWAFGGIDPASGLSVQTDLPNPSTRPGLRLPGRVTLAADLGEVPVDGSPARPGRARWSRRPTAARRWSSSTGSRWPARSCWPAGRAAGGPVRGADALGDPGHRVGRGGAAEPADGAAHRGAGRPDGWAGTPCVPLFVHPLPTQQGILATLDTARLPGAAGRACGTAGCPGYEQALRLPPDARVTGWRRSTPARSPRWS